ncbi:hypothetical protein EIN_222740 [Entamoeba invadens IP1]|uniref:Uncharacterized protein n=1 Tax=Entamoeba invadens IP1 TaxID=370355 RepID=A0A0A1U221_ENTIV|nr:hypothetical protein EIN_222740 [Entamoeba invadens IP1]ELP88111.1 hypothetical protein EIN_222740 [Entamoeba invadens IP1]|eukprot:XP_004254882.1 hypothetical protein EIN_222740 [Entamoeba invadens IP1]
MASATTHVNFFHNPFHASLDQKDNVQATFIQHHPRQKLIITKKDDGEFLKAPVEKPKWQNATIGQKAAPEHDFIQTRKMVIAPTILDYQQKQEPEPQKSTQTPPHFSPTHTQPKPFNAYFKEKSAKRKANGDSAPTCTFITSNNGNRQLLSPPKRIQHIEVDELQNEKKRKYFTLKGKDQGGLMLAPRLKVKPHFKEQKNKEETKFDNEFCNQFKVLKTTRAETFDFKMSNVGKMTFVMSV